MHENYDINHQNETKHTWLKYIKKNTIWKQYNISCVLLFTIQIITTESDNKTRSRSCMYLCFPRINKYINRLITIIILQTTVLNNCPQISITGSSMLPIPQQHRYFFVLSFVFVWLLKIWCFRIVYICVRIYIC